MKYVIGIVLIIFGFLVIWKTEWFLRAFGRNAWAEEKLGGGGTWTFYKLLGLASIFMAFLIMSGNIIKILDFIFPF